MKFKVVTQSEEYGYEEHDTHDTYADAMQQMRRLVFDAVTRKDGVERMIGVRILNATDDEFKEALTL